MVKLSEFCSSRPLTLGVELELQLVNTHDYDLVDCTEDLLRLLKRKKKPWDVKPEITQGMVEMATGICVSHDDVYEQLDEIRRGIVECADRLDIGVCGGGTHAFQHWSERRIYDTPRFDQLSSLYGYLAKQFTIFGQHVHVGCDNADQALTLLHLLSGFIPHLIALSASSPFVQGNDTGFHSARLNSIYSFPMSGRAPLIETWDSFGEYFDSMMATGIVKSMKDFYWDIRPKPEYGTIEVRVMDTPLTIEKAAQIAAFIQSLTRYLTLECPYSPRESDYLVYTFNRFQACRFGYEGEYVNPRTHVHRSLSEEILDILDKIESHAMALKADGACAALRREVLTASSDADWLRQQHEKTKSLSEVVQKQCGRWRV